jgi:predicted secreted hydrolase
MTRALHAMASGLLCLVAAAQPVAWKQAAPGRRIVLPADHRSHPGYRLEWWYYTGNLLDRQQRRFGYQLTFFRIGVNLSAPTPSAWAVRDVYMAHAAITDVAGNRHVAVERLNRAGIGWAGASDQTYRVWNEDWRAGLEDGRHRLIAATKELAVDLTLDEGKPPALHGADGFSQKGASAGNASYYYSLTRMPTRGTLRVGGQSYEVIGLSWMDHEYGTTFLERTQAGWDWFSIQLDDGSDLMMFRLRGVDGSADARSSGTVIARDGSTRALDAAAFTLVPGRLWRSGATDARYPVEWRLTVPGERLDLVVRAAIDAQELSGLASGVAYWEGAIDVQGTRRDRAIGGRGYLEMTGYAGRPMGEVMAVPQG